MDKYSKLRCNEISSRTIDTLIGLSKGLTADGKINQQEAEMLLGWLIQNKNNTNSPIIKNLFQEVSGFLSDDFLDDKEALDLLSTLTKIAGEMSEIGEIAKSAQLPLTTPEPDIEVQNHSFLLTGKFAYGPRQECHQLVLKMGGVVAKSVTKKLDYLVLGEYVTHSWKHETFGNKIIKAMEYRSAGIPINIVSEKQWLHAINLN